MQIPTYTVKTTSPDGKKVHSVMEDDTAVADFPEGHKSRAIKYAKELQAKANRSQVGRHTGSRR